MSHANQRESTFYPSPDSPVANTHTHQERSFAERAKRRAASAFATCAMGAWLLLALVPFIVVLVGIG